MLSLSVLCDVSTVIWLAHLASTRVWSHAGVVNPSDALRQRRV